MESTSESSVYLDGKNIHGLVKSIRQHATRPMKFMEVCGTHTMSIFRHGIRSLLPDCIELVSGPGCPVCVTGQDDIDRMTGLCSKKGVIIATFGDMIRVPGSRTSLAEARALGARVEIVYSPSNALQLALKNPGQQVIFLGLGFETTAPAVAATILQANAMNVDNFSVYSCHKVMPPVLETLFQDNDLRVDGLLCPGHVSTIIGARAYEDFCSDFHIPCVIAGFEPLDIFRGIYHLVRQARAGQARVENVYERAVTSEGNRNALDLMDKVFVKEDASWRGLGIIKKSGLGISDKFSRLDAKKRFKIQTTATRMIKGCICGKIIKANARPADCPFFAETCTPANPVGPCMVSSEGACAAYYRYGGHVKS